MADGTRTHDNRNHNPGLYQLSYSHHYFFLRLIRRSSGINEEARLYKGRLTLQSLFFKKFFRMGQVRARLVKDR